MQVSDDHTNPELAQGQLPFYVNESGKPIFHFQLRLLVLHS